MLFSRRCSNIMVNANLPINIDEKYVFLSFLLVSQIFLFFTGDCQWRPWQGDMLKKLIKVYCPLSSHAHLLPCSEGFWSNSFIAVQNCPRGKATCADLDVSSCHTHRTTTCPLILSNRECAGASACGGTGPSQKLAPHCSRRTKHG